MDVARVACVAILMLCSCGCSPNRAAIPDAQGAAWRTPVPPPNFGEWANWSHEKKLEFMRGTVEATEKALFVEYDPKRYANFTCTTCHGSGALNGKFKMPNPDLPKWPGGADAFRELKQRDPKMLTFMQLVIVPVTARLLGVKEFDMASHTGFSCFQCHTRG